MGICQLYSLYSFVDELKFSGTLFEQTFAGCAKMANQMSNEKKSCI